MKRISVIVPVYHGKKYIEPMIQQIEATAKKLLDEYRVELVFSNDAPDDELGIYSSSVVEIITLNTEANRGIHGARVRGLNACSGEYVLFLDQDDKIFPNFFKSQLRSIEECDACICNVPQKVGMAYMGTPIFEKALLPASMLEGNCIISPGQVLLKKNAISEIWKSNIMQNNGADDWLLWICMQGEKKKFVYNPEILYEHVEQGENASINYVKMQASEKEVYDIVRKSALYGLEQMRTLQKTIDVINTNRLKLLEKYLGYLFVMEEWLKAENREKGLIAFFAKHSVNKVALYGYGYLGKQIEDYLDHNGIEVACLIDRNAQDVSATKPVYTLEDNLPDVDAVLITLRGKVANVINAVKQKVNVPVWSFEEILNEQD